MCIINDLIGWVILLLHHVIINERWHDGDRNSVWALTEQFSNFLVFQTNHILSIDLTKVVVCQHSIPVLITTTA